MLRQLAFAFSLLLLVSGAWALNQSEISALASQLLPDNASFTLHNFTYRGSQAYAISSNGSIQGFVLPTLFFNQPALELDRGEIATALKAHYLSQGYSPDALSALASIHQGLQSVKDLHRRGEAKCRVLLGTDRFPCYDFETCQKACYSVTSFCLPVALGVGRPFVNSIIDFENNSRTLENSYEIEQQAYRQLSENSTAWNAQLYLSSIESINKAATRASQSPLYDDYSYCFSPDYSLPVITNLQLWAQTYYQNASRFYTIYEEADRIQGRSRLALALQAERQKAAAPLQANASSQPASSSSAKNETTAPQQQLLPQEAFPFAAGAAAFLSLFFIIALFLLLRKGKRRK